MDKRAKKILFSTYWKDGWVNDDDRYTLPEDLEYAKSKGLMFDPFSIHHDECIKAIHQLTSEIAVEKNQSGERVKEHPASLSHLPEEWRRGMLMGLDAAGEQALSQVSHAIQAYCDWIAEESSDRWLAYGQVEIELASVRPG